MYKVSVRPAQITLYVKEFDRYTESLELSTDMHAAGEFDSEEMMDLEKYIERALGVEIDWTGELDD
nr:MAG TPA: Protein of unknown function (DUF1493) [Caudoviricetes sp.]